MGKVASTHSLLALFSCTDPKKKEEKREMKQQQQQQQ